MAGPGHNHGKQNRLGGRQNADSTPTQPGATSPPRYPAPASDKDDEDDDEYKDDRDTVYDYDLDTDSNNNNNNNNHNTDDNDNDCIDFGQDFHFAFIQRGDCRPTSPDAMSDRNQPSNAPDGGPRHPPDYDLTTATDMTDQSATSPPMMPRGGANDTTHSLLFLPVGYEDVTTDMDAAAHEEAVRAHLSEVESSFLRPLSPMAAPQHSYVGEQHVDGDVDGSGSGNGGGSGGGDGDDDDDNDDDAQDNDSKGTRPGRGQGHGGAPVGPSADDTFLFDKPDRSELMSLDRSYSQPFNDANSNHNSNTNNAHGRSQSLTQTAFQQLAQYRSQSQANMRATASPRQRAGTDADFDQSVTSDVTGTNHSSMSFQSPSSPAIAAARAQSQQQTTHRSSLSQSIAQSRSPRALASPRLADIAAGYSTPRKLHTRSNAATPSHAASSPGSHQSATPAHTRTGSNATHVAQQSQPKYLRSRLGNKSPSSVSSADDDDGDDDDTASDATEGAATGEAPVTASSANAVSSPPSAPTTSLGKSLSSMLGRSMSEASAISGTDGRAIGDHDRDQEDYDGGGGGGGGGGGEQPDNTDERSRQSDQAFTTPRKPLHDPFATPVPNKQSMPTDTVIAAHVRKVQVPESLAQEYKFKSGLATPARPATSFAATTVPTSTAASASTPGPAAKRTGKALTLKEQSSTIERLSKENFDLKLKVMFLSDRLDKLSEEGIKEMISENVELKTSLAVIQRDNKMLRRRAKELEKKLREEEEHRPGTARSGASSGEHGIDHQDAQEREEELHYLRERLEECAVEMDRLRNESAGRESEKRRLTELLRNATSADRQFGGHNNNNNNNNHTGSSYSTGVDGRQEEADVWKDLLEQETARREQADEDNRRLRDEVFRLRQEASGMSGQMHPAANMYNAGKRGQQRGPGGLPPMSSASPGYRPVSSAGTAVDSGAMLSASLSTATLVEELRREGEQLRHENAELRREVGAQTSMLTSRNREKDRLYQEIEELKMAQRRGGGAPPSTVDSILDRSASRAGAPHERSRSRSSAMTAAAATRHATAADAAAAAEAEAEAEAEREELENRMAEMRDRANEVRLQNQDLQRELDACMEDFEATVAAKRVAEEQAADAHADLETAMNDLVALQAERDEALREQSETEAEFEALRKEAQDEIDTLEAEADQRDDELGRLQAELQDRTENFAALQDEMRKMGDVLVRLEDEQEAKLRRVQQLEHELAESGRELEELEAKLRESNDKADRLGIQLESSQGEVAFLREEQEVDKMRIGDLEAALANCEQSVRDERERAAELEDRLEAERRQRELVADKEKEEVQQFVNELNKEATSAKDDARKLRKSLTAREVEATEWKERLMELENNLREALGDLNGTRSSLLQSVGQLQRQLESSVRELDRARASIVEKERIVKQRDALLESHGLESRKLGDLLDKERQAHRNTRNQFETFQKTHQHVSRTVSTQDSRINDLESGRSQDKKRLVVLENQLKDQLLERNNLLLVLWTRLSTLCGSDWAHDNSLINGRALPSVESVATMLPGFAKNLLAAVKTIDSLLASLPARIKVLERDLYREYQTLEGALEMRVRKLDRLEALVRNGVATSAPVPPDVQARMARLEDACRQLKVENATLRTTNDVRARARAQQQQQQQQQGTDDDHGHRHVSGSINNNTHNGNVEQVRADNSGSPAPSVPTGPREHERRGLKKQSTPSTQDLALASSTGNNSNHNNNSNNHGSSSPSAEYARQQHHHPTSGPVATTSADAAAASGANTAANAATTTASRLGSSVGDHKWLLRLRDMEAKMKKEREDRNQDRASARQRLVGLEAENRELRGEMARLRRSSGGDYS